MKNIRTLCLTTLLAVATIVSCQKLEEMNNNPNQITLGETAPSSLLQNLLYDGNWTLQYRSWRINGDLMQYAMQSDGLEKISCFVLKASDSEMLWRNLSGSCMNAVHMAQLAVTQDDPNSQAIAITLKAFYVSAMTDIFGDMPYSEAFRIVGDNITHPKYDEQQDIYASLCDELKTADGLYDTSATYDGAGYDLLYNGDLKKWRKFTNALRLRLLLRQSRQVDVSAEMQEMVSGGVLFENNADGAILRFTGVVPFFNGFGPSGSLTAPAASQNKRMCSRLIGLLDDSGDPRLSKYADPVTVSGQQIYAGMLSGQEDDYINANKSITSNYARALSSDTQPSTFMSYAEQQFILAEAAARGYIAGDAEAYYKQAVRASVTEWCGDTAAAAVDQMLAHPRVQYDGTIERIIEQKWVSLFMVGFEAWCDYRRTGYPTLEIGPACENKNANGVATLPTRLCYPTISQTANEAQYRAAVERMGGKDDMLTKVWWASGTNY